MSSQMTIDGEVHADCTEVFKAITSGIRESGKLRAHLSGKFGITPKEVSSQVLDGLTRRGLILYLQKGENGTQRKYYYLDNNKDLPEALAGDVPASSAAARAPDAPRASAAGLSTVPNVCCALPIEKLEAEGRIPPSVVRWTKHPPGRNGLHTYTLLVTPAFYDSVPKESAGILFDFGDDVIFYYQ